MVARPQELLEGLHAPSRAEVLGAVKKVKNTVIGNRARKGAYIQAGIIPELIQLLNSTRTDAAMQIQVIATLGSLSCAGDSAVRQILDQQGLEALLDVVVHAQDDQVVEGAVRCVRMLCQGASVPSAPLLAPTVLPQLISLLSEPTLSSVAEGIATILASCCGSSTEQRTLTEAGAVPMITNHLSHWPAHSVHSALHLLALLLANNPTATSAALTVSTLDQLTSRLRDANGLTRALTVTCITHLVTSTPSIVPPITLTAPTNSAPIQSTCSAPSPPAPQPEPSLSLGPPLSRGGSFSFSAVSAAGATRVVSLPRSERTSRQPSNWDRVAIRTLVPLFRSANTEAGGGEAIRPIPVIASLASLAFNISANGAATGVSTINTNAPPHAAIGSTAAAFGLSARQLEVAVGGCAAAAAAGYRGGGESRTGPAAAEAGGGLGGCSLLLDEVMSSPVLSPSSTDVTERLSIAQRQSMPVALQLLGDGVAGDVAVVALSALVEDNDDLRSMAADADAARQVCALLAQEQSQTYQAGMQTPSQPRPLVSVPRGRVRESYLRVLGSLSMVQEEARKCMLESKVFDQIQSSLEDKSSAGVRVAAAQCIVALSRNVKTLKCNFQATEVAHALCRLLSDDDASVQVNACAALCNLVLEFSNVRDVALQMGAVNTLATHTGSHLELLRLYSSWALRNLCHKSSGGIKTALMQALGWHRMRSLLSDTSETVQEQAVCMLRNLCMDAAEHISLAYEWGGPELLAALEDKLDPCKQVPSVLRVHSLYVLVNSLTGSDSIKDMVMLSNLPALLLHHMKSTSDSEVRLPAVWCIINLIWVPSISTTNGGGSSISTSQQAAGSAVESRLKRLRELGAVDSLKELLVDSNSDVRERARHALELMLRNTTNSTNTTTSSG